MNNKKLYILWGVLAAVCMAMSFLDGTEDAPGGLMLVLSLAFFAPPSVLLYRAVRSKNCAAVALIRRISLGSLTATFALLLANFLSVGASRLTGDVLYALLALVSVPMVCSQIWALSLFLWACLLIVGIKYRKM